MQILKTECYHDVENKYKNRWGDRVEKFPISKKYISYFSRFTDVAWMASFSMPPFQLGDLGTQSAIFRFKIGQLLI